ncbi:MAG: hypothetical protein WBJ81_01775, partial [Rickettsiales bacterium]
IATTEVTSEINDNDTGEVENLTITKTGKNGESKTGTITIQNKQTASDDDGNKTGGSAYISTAKRAGTITIGNKQTSSDDDGNKTGESADINISGKNGGSSTGSISKTTDGYIDNTAVRTSSSTGNSVTRHTDGSRKNIDTEVSSDNKYSTTYKTQNEDGTISANHQKGNVGNDPFSTINTVISSTGVQGAKYINDGSVDFQTSEGVDGAGAPEKVINATRYDANDNATNSSLVISSTGDVEATKYDDNGNATGYKEGQINRNMVKSKIITKLTSPRPF